MTFELTPEKKALIRAADALGGQAALATAIGFADRRHVWPWFNTERRVPPEKCPDIERATKGAVTCEELRPDVAWGVLRGTDGAPAASSAQPAAFADSEAGA